MATPSVLAPRSTATSSRAPELERLAEQTLFYAMDRTFHEKAPEAEETNDHNLQQEDDIAQLSPHTIVALLKNCAEQKDLSNGRKFHACIVKKGLLETDLFIGSSLISMYAKCGSLSKAQEVFDELPVRNAVSWNALISGYGHFAHGEDALKCFEQMQHESILPNAVTFVCVFKACGSIGALKKGREIHAGIAKKRLLEKDVYVGTALVDMYAKCGRLAKAQEVFDMLPIRNIVSWNALIAGYAQHGYGEEALDLFRQMQHQGFSPNSVTFICSLQACSSIGALDKGKDIHAEIERNGLLDRDIIVGTALLDMYAKCGSFAKAQYVHDRLPIKTVVSWNALIAGYVQHGWSEQALHCLEQMQLEGIFPDAVTIVSSLKACGSIRATEKGQKIHVEIYNGLVETERSVGIGLVDMYAKCGLVAEAQKVFDKLPVKDVVSWSALIAGYAEHGHGEEALNCFQQMQCDRISPNEITYICILKACGNLGSIDKGQEIHADIAANGLLEKHVFVGTALVDMYARCGMLVKAQEVFDKLQVRDVVSWNALITGYAQHGWGEQALTCYERMRSEGISQNAVTFICSLKACGSIKAIDKGQEIHREIAEMKLLETDPVLGAALVDMYAKCGFLAKAQDVCDNLPVRNIASWNTLISGYTEHRHGEEALNCFERMQLEGITPDAVTFICSLKACGSIGAIEKGQTMHSEIIRKGLLATDVSVGNALVDMYVKCGFLAKAREVFDELPVRNIISWNSLITGYAQQGSGDEALECFEHMQKEGICPDAVTFLSGLKACGVLGATDKGQGFHIEIAKTGLVETDLAVGSALVDMYAKCGLLAKARDVFDKLPVRGIVVWNALITGYAQLGEAENGFYVFESMIEEGMMPSLATFTGVLNACSHSGLVDMGNFCFEHLSKDFSMAPALEHITCVIDMLGRAGQFDKVVAIIKGMPHHANLVTWHTILGACRKWGNAELGKQAFKHAVQLDEKSPASYISISNIFSDTSRMQEV